MVANTFNGFAKDGSQIMPNAAAGSISLLYMFVAVLFGLYLKKFRPTAGIQLVVGIVLMCLMLWVGIANPIYLDSVTWRYVVFAYLFAASVMPMWLLKQPRDYLSMFLLIGMIVVFLYHVGGNRNNAPFGNSLEAKIKGILIAPVDGRNDLDSFTC